LSNNNLTVDLSNLDQLLNDWCIPLIGDKSRYLVCYGGAGSGKSVFCAQKLVLRMLLEKNHKFLIVRKFKSTHKNSTFSLIRSTLASFGLANHIQVNKTDLTISVPAFDTQFLFIGIDDPEKIKSVAGITSIWIEESTELDEEDFDQLNLRLRGYSESYKQFLISFNPVDESNFLKKRLIDNEDIQHKVTIKRSTYKDNKFLDDEYIRMLEQDMRSNEQMYRVYVLGEFGRPSVKGQFYKCFSVTKHVKPCSYDPSLPLHISTDQNIVPFYPTGIFQIMDKKIRMIDQIALESPNNSTEGMCNEFINRFPNHEAGLFVYGDATSRKGDTRSGENDYQIMLRLLKDYHPVLRVPKSNPPVAMRGQYINAILDREFEGITIEIDNGCNHMISDLLYGKEAPDGTKLKERAKDKETGQTYQRFHHFSDILDYLICNAFEGDYLKFVRGRSINIPIVPKRLVNQRRY
jgi:phage terminase large subunit